MYPLLSPVSFSPVAIVSPLYSRSLTFCSLTIPLKLTLSEINMSKVLPDFVPSGISKSILVFKFKSVVSSVLSSVAVGLTVVFSPLSAPPMEIFTLVMTSVSSEPGLASASDSFREVGSTWSAISNIYFFLLAFF